MSEATEEHKDFCKKFVVTKINGEWVWATPSKDLYSWFGTGHDYTVQGAVDDLMCCVNKDTIDVISIRIVPNLKSIQDILDAVM